MVGPRPEQAVDFVVIGAMKSMTTSLLATLSSHPGVAVSKKKETQYFVAETGWRQGPAWYAEQFAHARPDQLRGEASPQYTFFPVYAGVAERMADAAPAVRLLYLVREPVSRAVSQWRHATARGKEQRPLAEALLIDARYQAPSRYWLQLQQYFRVFGEEQVRVIDADRFVRDPASTLREVVEHIGADPGQAPTELVHHNAAADRRQVRPVWARAQEHAAARRFEQLARRAAPEAWQRWTTVESVAPVLDEDLAHRLREVLAADASALGSYLGAAAPSWAR